MCDRHPQEEGWAQGLLEGCGAQVWGTELLTQLSESSRVCRLLGWTFPKQSPWRAEHDSVHLAGNHREQNQPYSPPVSFPKGCIWACALPM